MFFWNKTKQSFSFWVDKMGVYAPKSVQFPRRTGSSVWSPIFFLMVLAPLHKQKCLMEIYICHWLHTYWNLISIKWKTGFFSWVRKWTQVRWESANSKTLYHIYFKTHIPFSGSLLFCEKQPFLTEDTWPSRSPRELPFLVEGVMDTWFIVGK